LTRVEKEGRIAKICVTPSTQQDQMKEVAIRHSSRKETLTRKKTKSRFAGYFPLFLFFFATGSAALPLSGGFVLFGPCVV